MQSLVQSVLMLWLLGIATCACAAEQRHRVLVSTDIGGTDPDDIQSLVYLLLYADVLEIEGIVSSPYGEGREQDILRVIDAYEQDFSRLRNHTSAYPKPESLRAITKQGATERAPADGVRKATAGSEWMVTCAERDDPRPLHVLVWGGLEDLAQALHDAPQILPKLRVYWIGGPNKKWSVDAYNYIEQQHPRLWMIEANATYRGWFVGGPEKGPWSNDGFVATHVAGHGALGELFVRAKRDLKMGDTPSVARLLSGSVDDPTQPSWGGRFVPIWDERKTVFDRLTTETDKVEVFGVTEFALPVPAGYQQENRTTMVFLGSRPASPGVLKGQQLRFRFSPRDAKAWPFELKSDFAGLNGQQGSFEAVPPPLERTRKTSAVHPNWWIDDPDPAMAEGVHPGARSVSRWRTRFLRDFAGRLDRCQPESSKESTADVAMPNRWGEAYLQLPPAWYATADALGVADSVMRYQSPQGGWPKNTNLAELPKSTAEIPQPGDGRANTIDNGATTLPIQFLARVADATGDADCKASVARGLDYLLAAQYDVGGWPQFYPLRKGYYSHITYNDGAMIHVMELLHDVVGGEGPFTFVDAERRSQAEAAIAKGIKCILETQVWQDGKPAVWCAQHDVGTLEPAWARAYEIPSLSGSESVGITRFLMEKAPQTPEVVAAIEGAIAWFKAVQIRGLKYVCGRNSRGERDCWVEPDSDAPPLWARFYDLESNRPLFAGRDRVIHDSLAEVEQERRRGYAYYGNWAKNLLAKNYPRWRAKRERAEKRENR